MTRKVDVLRNAHQNPPRSGSDLSTEMFIVLNLIATPCAPREAKNTHPHVATETVSGTCGLSLISSTPICESGIIGPDSSSVDFRFYIWEYIQSKKPNHDLARSFGLDVELAEYLFLNGISDEAKLAFSDDSGPINMDAIKAILGTDNLNRIRSQIADKARKVIEMKSDKRDLKLERRNKEKDKKIRKKESFEENYNYLEFKSRKARCGNFRSTRLHPNKIRKEVLKLGRNDKGMPGVYRYQCDGPVEEVLRRNRSRYCSREEKLLVHKYALEIDTCCERYCKDCLFVICNCQCYCPVCDTLVCWCPAGLFSYDLSEDDEPWIHSNNLLSDSSSDDEPVAIVPNHLRGPVSEEGIRMTMITSARRVRNFVNDFFSNSTDGREDLIPHVVSEVEKEAWLSQLPSYFSSKWNDFIGSDSLVGKIDKSKIMEVLKKSLSGVSGGLLFLFDKLKDLKSNFLSDGIYNLLLNTVILIYDIATRPDIVGCIIALYHFFSMTGIDARVVAESGLVFLHNFVDNVKGIFAKDYGPQQESVITTAESIYKFINKALSSKLVDSIKVLLLGAASIKVFSKNITGGLKKFFGKSKAGSLLEVFKNVCESIFYFLRVGDMIYDGVPVVEAMLAKDPTAQLIHDIQEILSWKDEHLYHGLPQPEKMDRIVWGGKVKNFMQCTDALLKRISSHSTEYKTLFKLSLDMKTRYIENQQELQKNKRKTPILIIIDSAPGVGKTTLMEFVCKIYCLAKGREFDWSQVFTRNPTSDYFEGVDTLSQDILHYSELGNTAKSLAKIQGEKLLLEVTTLADALPFAVDMAFESKGKMYCNWGLIAIDTNTFDLNSEYTINNRGALMRRALRMTPAVKRDIRKHGSVQLDPQKSLASDLPFMDKWTVELTTYLSCDDKDKYLAQPFKNKKGNTELDIYETTKLLYDYMCGHINEQEAIMASNGPDHHPLYYLEKYQDRVDELIGMNYEVMDSEDEEKRPVQEMGNSVPRRKLSEDEKIEVDPRRHNLFHDIQSGVDGVVSGVKVKFDKSFIHTLRSDITEVKQFTGKEKRKAFFDMSWELMIFILIWYVRAIVIRTFTLGDYIPNVFKDQFNTKPDPRPWKFSSRLLSWNINGLIICMSWMLRLNWITFLYSFIVIVWNIQLTGAPAMISKLFVNSYYNSRKAIVSTKIEKFKFMIGLSSKYDPFNSIWWQKNKDNMIMLLEWTAFAATIYAGKKVYDHVRKPQLEVLKEKNKENVFYTDSVGTFKLNDKFQKEYVGDLYNVHTGIKMHPKAELSNFLSSDNKYIKELADIERHHDMGKSRERILNGHMEWVNTRIVVKPTLNNLSPQSLAKSYKVAANIRYVVMTTSTEHFDGYIFGVCGNYALMNRHFFKEESMTIHVSTTGGFQLGKVTKPTKVHLSDTVPVFGDLIMIRLNGVLFSNILSHLTSDREFFHTHKAYIEEADVKATFVPVEQKINECQYDEFVLPSYWIYDWLQHAQGKCGLVLTVERGNGSIIAGIHTAGYEEFGYASPLFKDDVERAISNMDRQGFTKLHSDYPIVEERNLSTITPPHKKSPWKYEQLERLDYFGALPGNVNMNNKSGVRSTPFRNDIKEFFKRQFNFKATKLFGPPRMKKFVNEQGEYISPWNNCLKSMAIQKPALDQRILKRVKKELVDKICDSFGNIQLKPIDFETVVNGVKEDYFTRKMNVTTSAGFGWGGQKVDHLPVVYQDAEKQIREPTEKLVKRLIECVKRYENGEICNFVLKACLKDEPREYKKYIEGKTRVFYSSPIEYVMLAKAYLSPFYTTMVEKGHLFGSCVGINIMKDADKLVKDLRAKSDRVNEFDYKQFDIKIPDEIRALAAAVVEEVLIKLGYSEANMQIVRGLLTEGLVPLILMNGDLFRAFGIQPSGKYATAEDNTLINLIILMFVWYSIVDDDFYSNVCPKTYGDDVATTVEEHYHNVFNSIIFKNKCEELLDMTVTGAEKDGNMAESIGIDEFSFLKRRFRFSYEFNRYIALLDMESIFKSLTVYIPSPAVTMAEQFEGTFQAAVMELFNYTDANQFDIVRDELIDIYSRYFGIPSEIVDKRIKRREDIIRDLGF